MITERSSKDIQRENQELRRQERQNFLDSFEQSVNSKHIESKLIEKGVANSLNPSALDSSLRYVGYPPNTISKDNLSQVLIGEGYKRIWTFKQRGNLDLSDCPLPEGIFQKPGRMFFVSFGENGKVEKLIVVDKRHSRPKSTLETEIYFSNSYISGLAFDNY